MSKTGVIRLALRLSVVRRSRTTSNEDEEATCKVAVSR